MIRVRVDIERKNTYKINDLKKDKLGEYEEFANQKFDYEEEEEKYEVESCIEQEIFNLKVERILGIEEEKMVFDQKYKESLVRYINNHSFKDRSNTGTVIGNGFSSLHFQSFNSVEDSMKLCYFKCTNNVI